VALIPDMVAKLVKSGFEVIVQSGAGTGSSFSDDAYQAAGARIVPDASSAYGEADITLKVQRPSVDEVNLLREGSCLISLLQPNASLEIIPGLQARRITAFSMDLVPRITRAQDMDVLSSMSTLAGYRAVLLGAVALGKLLPMVVSAAGTLTAARVLVLGAGVAGLQAIATARRLGAVVQAFDIRPATKEQVQSLGATFVDMDLKGEQTEEKSGYAKELSQDSQDRVLQTIAKPLRTADLVISTALIPGKPAPRLITADMVATMKPGAVIVDMAAEMGGNCELTEAGKDVVRGGVTILGPVNLASQVAVHASQMYSKNVSTVLRYFAKDCKLQLDFEDQVVRDMCVTHEGQIRSDVAKKLLGIA
jgi:NAD(P) transhydrogenase subunit alpha